MKTSSKPKIAFAEIQGITPIEVLKQGNYEEFKPNWVAKMCDLLSSNHSLHFDEFCKDKF